MTSVATVTGKGAAGMLRFERFALLLALLGSSLVQAGDWPPETRNTFRQSCIDSATQALGKQRALLYCGCTVARIGRDFSTADIAELEKTQLSESLIKRLQQVSQQCLGELRAQR